jgi:hypothetical protein
MPEQRAGHACVLALQMARLSGFTRSQLCARRGVQAVVAVMGICRTHTTIVKGGGHGSASERTSGLAEIGGKSRRGPYFRCKARSPRAISSPAYRRLGPF